MPKLGIDFISHNWFLDSLGVVSCRGVELVGLLFSIFVGESLIFLLLLINFFICNNLHLLLYNSSSIVHTTRFSWDW